ncbi:MAG: type II toxin-antitoxin system VapC family toxin [Candidatus Bathyarchaeia archaeon]
MKVIDSSALIKYVAKEENWETVETHIKEGCKTLELAIKETANALAKKTLKNEVTVELSKEIIAHLPKIVKIAPQTEQIPKALEIAAKHKITIYDALFIALAVNTSQQLLTSDKKQAGISEKYVTTILIL